MTNTWLRRWLPSSGSRSTRGGARRKAGFRPGCEHLEQRELLTVSWVGLGNPDAAGLRTWLDDLNWREVVPGGLGNFRLPQLNENLIFGNDSAPDARATRNGFPTDFAFGGVTFSAPGYSVAANSALNPSNRFILGGTLVGGAAGITPVDVDIRINANRTVNVVNNSTLQLRGAISGAGAINKGFPGVLELGGGTGNSFTGGVTVGGGTLLLNKTAGNAVSGSGLTIVNATGLETVRLLQDNQIADNAAVVVGGACLLDLTNRVETFGPLTITGGRVEIGTGTLSVQGAITTNASGAEARINGSGAGTLALRPVAFNQQTVNVANGAAPFDLVITARLASGVAGTGLNKVGTGVLSLRGPGTYDGLTTVGAGILNIQNNTALGATSAGTTVASGAVLQLQGGLTVAEPVTLFGTGIGGQSALDVFNGGTNTLTGPVSLASNTTIDVTGGTTLVISGAMNDGVNTFGWTKLGLGTVILPAGANHFYDGATVVEDGTLQVDGTITSAVTVAAGGTLTGTGIIDPAGAVGLVVNQGGILSPGVAGVSNGIGTLRVDGNVTFGALSTFRVELSSAGGDSLQVTGANRTINLLQSTTNNPILNATAIDPIPGGTEFRIIERTDPTGTIITGRFQGLLNNPDTVTISGQAFFIGYTAGGAFNDIVLQRNTAPMVEYIFLYPDVILAGEFTTVYGQLTDPDADDFHLLYVWWGDGTEDYYFPGLDPFEVSHQYLEPGDYTLYVFWYDQFAEGNFAEMYLSVLAGAAPGGAPGAPGAGSADAVDGLLPAGRLRETATVAEAPRADAARGAVAGEAAPVGLPPDAWDALLTLGPPGGKRSDADPVFAPHLAALDGAFADAVL